MASYFFDIVLSLSTGNHVLTSIKIIWFVWSVMWGSHRPSTSDTRLPLRLDISTCANRFLRFRLRHKDM